MRQYFKETWVGYLLSLALSYMMFIHEPVVLYSSSTQDLWFDLGIMIKFSFIGFILLFFGLIILLNIIYKLNKKLFKISEIIFFAIFFLLYIQGNYLIFNLPVLDGTPIKWSDYNIYIILYIIVFIVLVYLFIKILKKDLIEKYIKYSGYITIVILLMIITSTISLLFKEDTLKSKDNTIMPTNEYINEYSSNKNFIILVLDATDSRTFNKALTNNKEFNNMLKDFTYYPDTLSSHPYTLEAVPYILTGKNYYNQESLMDFQIKAFKESYLLNELYKENYEIGIYENYMSMDKDTLSKIKNNYTLEDQTKKISKKKFLKEEIKYILFKYLPFPLKRFSKISSMNMSLTNLSMYNSNFFIGSNYVFNNQIKEEYTKIDNKVFKFIHLEGPHIPFNFNKELEYKDNVFTYYDEVEGTATIVSRYLNKLKQENIYDNSAIIIMGDHGYNTDDSIYGRQNPILYIKGINEKHDKMNISDKAIEYADLNDAYKNLLNDKKTNELFVTVPNKRTRKFILYVNSKKNHMEEYETKDKAWETDKAYKTGKVFDLKK